MVKRSDTGTPKGSAFVQFDTKEAADKLLEEAYVMHICVCACVCVCVSVWL